MSIITSISINNADWDYIREHKLSPTRLFKIGLERTRNTRLIADDEVSIENTLNLKQKISSLIEAIRITTERAERAEQLLQMRRNLE